MFFIMAKHNVTPVPFCVCVCVQLKSCSYVHIKIYLNTVDPHMRVDEKLYILKNKQLSLKAKVVKV